MLRTDGERKKMANAQKVTGQYECQHSSGIGLDYFTSRIDRLILRSDGRFTLIVQKHSRAAGAAQAWLKGEQVSANAQETRMEGNYTQQDRLVTLRFDNGGIEEAHLAWNGSGIQVGPNFFTKVSDSTLLPPTHRIKQDMEDIAKGVKIASTVGGFAMKAAKTLQETFQPAEQTDATSSPTSPAPNTTLPAQPAPPQSTRPAPPPAATTGQGTSPPSAPTPAARFCDQCGARCRPGKRFCGNCGAPLI